MPTSPLFCALKNRMKQYLAKLQEANFRVWLECISRVITVAPWNYHQSIFYKEFKIGARISLALCQVALLQFGCHEVVKPWNKWISFYLTTSDKVALREAAGSSRADFLGIFLYFNQKNPISLVVQLTATRRQVPIVHW